MYPETGSPFKMYTTLSFVLLYAIYLPLPLASDIYPPVCDNCISCNLLGPAAVISVFGTVLTSSVVAVTAFVYVSVPSVTVNGTVPIFAVSSNTNTFDVSSISNGSAPVKLVVTFSSVRFDNVSVTTFELLTVVVAFAVGLTQTRWYK